VRERSKTIEAARLIGSLILGLGLAVGLLMALAPQQQAQAQGEGPDLRVDKFNNAPWLGWHAGYARPGGPYIYGIAYRNWFTPSVVATDTIIVDTLPASTTYAGDTSGFMHTLGTGGVITWYLGDLHPDDGDAFMVTLNVSSTVPTGTDVITRNCAFITSTVSGDYDPNNNYVCSDPADVWDDEIDLSVDKWIHPDDPTPGQEFQYTINWCNERGAVAGPVWLTDTLPISSTVVDWTWQEQWGERWWEKYWTEVITTGGQFVLYAPSLPGNMCQELYLTLLLDPDAPLGAPLENTVVITTPGQVDVEAWNNRRFHEGPRVSGPRYDVGADKSINGGIFVSGGWIQYHVEYRNQGNSAAHVWLTDTLPEGTSFVPGNAWQYEDPFTPTVTTDDELVWDLGVLGVGHGGRFDVRFEISDTVGAGTAITNCVSVGITETESFPLDNTDCVTTMVYPSGPNLHIDKGHEWHGPGEIGYRIYFANYGDQTVSNVRVTDTFPISTTSYPWEHWPGVQYHRQVTITSNYTDSQWLFQIEEINPGESGQLDFNVTLDDPGAPLRWYTNTVEIETPPGDPNPADNAYTDVAFSGGEVNWVDLDVYGNSIWGCARSAPVTITTAYTEMVLGWECWGEWFEDPFMPGDVVTVAAGGGVHPVVIHIPDPFEATADSNTDMVWGQIDALDHEWVEVHPDHVSFPKRVQTDDSGNFSATFPDVPRGVGGEVRYRTEIDYANVTFHRQIQPLDLILNVNYAHDWVEGNYEAGHTVWLTVTESDGTTVKATAVLTTGAVPWWGGQTGFSTNWQGWWPDQPDIQAGDWVFGLVDNGQATQVHVGEITGTVDVDSDSITGRIYATWFTETLYVECQDWAEVGAPGKEDTAGPDGDPPYYCEWDPATEWDVQPGEEIGVWYEGSDRNRVANGFREPVPYLRVDKWANGNPAEGGNFVFHIDYWNDSGYGNYAENVVISDTLLGGMAYLTDTSGLAHTGSGAPGDPLVWNLGTVPEGWGGGFDVFVEVTASEGDAITNTVEITTSSPYNQSPPEERYSEWSGTVQANDTHLGVDKYIQGSDPAPDTEFTWAVNVCNGGSTASSELTLTDTLPISTTLLGWWGQHSGWAEALSTGDQLVLSYPSIPAWWCGEVYLRFHLDEDAWINMPISNTAEISAANDLEGGSVVIDWRWVRGPYANLYVRKNWLQGQLVPDGDLSYEMEYGNDGSAPADDVFITYTLPASTTFDGAWWNDQYGQQHPFTPDTITADYVVWDLGTLENGFSRHFGVSLHVDKDASPGTILTSTVEITPHPTDFHYDDNAVTWAEMLNDEGPNLEVHKQNYSWNGNNQIQYEMRVKNRGTERLEPVWITDTYPISTTWDGNWWYGHGPQITTTHDVPNRQIRFWLEALDPGETASIGFQMELDGAIHGVQGLFFTNTLSAPIPDDVYPADNTDEVVAYAGPNIFVEKWLSGGEPRPGEVVTFTVKFGNRNRWQGIDGMWRSHLTDTLPAGMTFITATAPWDPNQRWHPDQITGTTSVRWGWDTPWPDSAWYFDLVAQITDTVQSGEGLTNVVEYHDDNPNNLDLFLDDNVFELPLTILDPVFEVGKVYESNRVAGMPVTYTLTVTNTGNYPGTNVVLSDTIPAYLDIGTDGTLRFGGTLQFPWIWWVLGPIAPYGGTDTAEFYATLPCTVGLSIVNDDYGVRGSDQGVISPPGDPVSFTVLTPALSPTFTQSATVIDADTTVTFTDTSTTDGTDIVAWAWDFGDGGVGSGEVVSHTYGGTGGYTVTLTITDTCRISESNAVPNAVVIAETYVFLPLVMRSS